jgi:hypothetical protein
VFSECPTWANSKSWLSPCPRGLTNTSKELARNPPTTLQKEFSIVFVIFFLQNNNYKQRVLSKTGWKTKALEKLEKRKEKKRPCQFLCVA